LAGRLDRLILVVALDPVEWVWADRAGAVPPECLVQQQ
jgi:hypothetical protein